MNLSRAFAAARRIVGTSRTRSLAVIALAATLFVTGSAQAQTIRTWDNGAGTSVLTTAANWSGDLVPASTGTTAATRQDARFDGSVAGTLNLTYGSAFGGTSGVGLVLSGSQTSPVNITNTSATEQDIRLINSTGATVGGIQIASGAGALTIGAAGTANPVRLVLGAGATGVNLNYYFSNSSTGTATIEQNASIVRGGSHNANLIFDSTGSWDVKGVVGLLGSSGAGSLQVNGGANVTLSANNSAFDAALYINGGTLNFSAANNLGVGTGAVRLGQTTTSGVLRYTGSSDATISRQMRIGNGDGASHTGGATIQNDGAGALTFSNATFNEVGNAGVGKTLTLRGSNAGNNTISGSIVNNLGTVTTVSLIKTDTGTWILSGSNSFTGGVNIDLGTLVVGNDNALGTGTVNLRADAVGEVARLRADATARTITNAINFGGNANAQANYLGGVGSGKLTLSGSVNWGSGSKTYTIDGSTVEFGGTWTGASTTAINTIDGTDVATSILILNGDRGTAAKEINIGSGLTVRVNNNNSFGSNNTEPLSLLGATRTSVVELENNITLARTLDVQGRDEANANVALRNRSGNNALAITVGSGGTRYNIDSADGTLTISSVGGLTGTRDLFVTGAGNVVLPNWNTRRDLTMNGSGTLTISSSSSHTGTTRIVSGGLSLGDALALQNSTLNLDAADSGTITSIAANSTLGGLQGSRNLDMLGRTLSIGNNNASTTYSGALSNGALTKIGTGTFTLTGANTYSGATTVSAGMLELGAGGSITSTSNISVGAAGTLLLNGGSVSLGSKYILNSGTYDVNGQTVAAGSYNASAFWAANAKLMNSSATAAVIEGTGSTNTVWINAAGATIETVGALTIRSIVTDGGGVRGFTKTGAGTLVLEGEGQYSGETRIAAGGLSIGNATALQFSTLNLDTADAGTVTAISQNSTLGGLSGSRNLDMFTRTLSIGNNNASTTYSGVLSNGSLEKIGTGVLTLSGSNTYGATTVSAGTLQAGNAAAFGSGVITLASGATLDLGSLAVANAITNNGGTVVNYGSYTGTLTLTTGTQTLENVSGTLDLDGSTGDLTGTIDAVVVVKGGGRGRALGQIKKNVTVNGGSHFDIEDGASIDDAATFGFTNNGQIHIDRTSDLTISKVISGTGTLLKSGNSKLVLSAANTSTGLTRAQGGQLKVNGRVGGSVQVDSGAEIGGSGVIAGSLLGDGLIGPGNSPGILTVEGSVSPSASTAFAFELSGTGSPVWSNASASVNDVLRLTNADPFTTALLGSNVVNIYFERTSLAQDDTFLGGFFIDNPSQINGLLAGEVGAATFQYFVLGDGQSTGNAYNGKNYYTLAQFNSSLSVDRSYVNVASANFAGGTVTTGQVTQFVIVPEPGTLAGAGIGLAAIGWRLASRRRNALRQAA